MHRTFYTLRIANITCGSCVPKIQKCLKNFEYVNNVKINIFTKEVQLEMHTVADSTKIEHIKRVLSENGFTISDDQKYWRNMFYALILLYIIQIVMHRTMNIFWMDLVLSTVIQVLCSRRIFRGSMAFTDTIILGSHASFILGCLYDAQSLQISSLILVMVVLGKFILEIIGNKASEFLRTGLTEYYVYNNENINYEEIKDGYMIVIEQEKHILFDGIVVEGSSYVDESNLTGEMKLKEKKKNDFIYSGTYNKAGCVTVLVHKVGKETYLGRILRQIDHSPADHTSDIRSLFYFIIFITICSFLMCLINSSLTQAVKTSLSLLIIACPCALNISEPLTVLVGTKKLFDNSVVIRDLTVFDSLGDLNVLFIDKTGTLTDGTFRVKDFIPILSLDIGVIKALIHTLEKMSYHPVASALVEYCTSPVIGEVLNYEVVRSGVRGRVLYKNAQYDVQIGNDGMLTENNRNNLHFVANISIENSDNTSNTFKYYIANDDVIDIYVVINGELACIFYLEDKIINGAKSALKLLNEQNITTIMLTGDSYTNAKRVAHRLNINKVYASKTAVQKSKIIQNYRKGHVVGMIGDGINDYCAIAQSNIGISIGNVFSEIGHVSLLCKDLHLLYILLVIGKRIRRRIIINFTLSIVYNAAALFVGVFGSYYGLFITPSISCMCMFLSSLTVIISALMFR
ncbi:HAD ATPase, P-type, family IC [Vavraia culicis subsp. floridensis]|uniref:HAD ATPase, P-type, family IC n=1 Tax=Vavraia culicis (isolate floridensis) TaxID=948595 RepID=L2GVK3_VAVCU|nr:HAD ATPase, P-type, family IC [Vavraia culicis subsp. floridensis]ELA47706.1 HAD ATPase, P-type, family IC [Vavraia culicis subsp. floridensis]